VRNIKDEDIDFSMDTSIVRDKVTSWIGVIFSKTLILFHGTILGAIVIVTIAVTLSAK
jgi:hypothetical protein